MEIIDHYLMAFLDNPLHVVLAAAALFLLVLAILHPGPVLFFGRFVGKSLARNRLRTALTGVATIVLVLVVILVWTVLYFLDLVTAERTKDLKAIVTERWQIPSQMPFAYEAILAEGAARSPGDTRPQDYMTWQFFGGTLDPVKRTRENIVFFFCMDPAKLLTIKDGKPESMMDGIDEFTPEEITLLDKACRAMEEDKRRVVMGWERLQTINKRVGERFTLTGLNYTGIDLEVEIIGMFPKGSRYDQSAIIHRDYLNDALEAYKRKNGKPHPLADKSLNLVWLRVPDTNAFARVARQIETSPQFTSPAVKCETASSGVASFLDAYRDLLWGMRWLLVPAILVTMALVIANAISISVRERRTEMAVLKVLGFGPGQVMALILGEALLIGCLSGLIGAGGTFLIINKVIGGIKFPVAFFPAFKVPLEALWWGPLIGGLTALAGSLVPSWSARSVKVAEVFSKVA